MTCRARKIDLKISIKEKMNSYSCSITSAAWLSPSFSQKRKQISLPSLFSPRYDIWVGAEGFFFFWLHHPAYKILVPWPGIEPVPSAVKVWSPNHWTAREFPKVFIFDSSIPCTLQGEISKATEGSASFSSSLVSTVWVPVLFEGK